MVLTDETPRRGAFSVTPKAQLLLDALKKQAGQWLSRKDLAVAIDKSGARLNPNDIRQLQKMASAGLIQERKATDPSGLNDFRYEYRYNP